jgi:CheY-like chemotaxis protein
MMLQALLVSKDDQTAETLIQVLAQLGVAVVRSSAADAADARLSEASFDQVIVDFEDPETASHMLESCRRLAGANRNLPVTVALLADARQIRAILGSGAHFVLTKPVSAERALATLSAATAILKRERRQAPRVAVQVPVSIRGDQDSSIEGILLDVSAGGMDVLAAKPVASSSLAQVFFELPDSLRIEANAEVAWSTATGQIGLRFLDMDSKMREQLGEWLKSHSNNGLPEEPVAIRQCKLTDLSLGGCYVETESPFPQSSAVDLCLKAADMEIHAEGLVRVMHPSQGMGIEFPARTEDQRKSVADFIECLTGHPGAQPELEISPRSLVANAVDLSQGDAGDGNAEDPLLELLRTGGGMEQEEFLAELSQQRAPANVSE